MPIFSTPRLLHYILKNKFCRNPLLMCVENSFLSQQYVGCSPSCTFSLKIRSVESVEFHVFAYWSVARRERIMLLCSTVLSVILSICILLHFLCFFCSVFFCTQMLILFSVSFSFLHCINFHNQTKVAHRESRSEQIELQMMISLANEDKQFLRGYCSARRFNRKIYALKFESEQSNHFWMKWIWLFEYVLNISFLFFVKQLSIGEKQKISMEDQEKNRFSKKFFQCQPAISIWNNAKHSAVAYLS